MTETNEPVVSPQAPAPTVFGDDLDFRRIRRQLYETALLRCGDNRTHAAAMLGVSVRTLQREVRLAGLRRGRPPLVEASADGPAPAGV